MSKNQYILNVKSSNSVNLLRFSTKTLNLFFLYNSFYRKAVESAANDEAVSPVTPLPEISAVYLLSIAALRKKIAIKGRLVNLKMDSILDYKGGYSNLCIESLQVILFDDLPESQQSSLSLDQLRMYPSLVLNKKMDGLQDCYLKHSSKIIFRVNKILNDYSIKIPTLNKNYNHLDPYHVVKWLESILIENTVSPEYITNSAKAIFAISNLSNLDQNTWLKQCLDPYKSRFESLYLDINKTLDKESSSRARQQLNELIKEINKNKQNKRVGLEVVQRVSF